MMSMMERYLLRYFLAVVDHGSFNRAASACNVSQPTLSVGIAKLERSLGTPLFVRAGQRTQLTPAGSRLLSHARRIEAEFNLAQRAVAAEAEEASAPLRIGILHSIPGDIVAQAVADRPPGEAGRMEIVYGSAQDLAGRLDRGRIDVALSLMQGADARFAERPVATEGYAIAIRAGHPLGERASVHAEEVASETMIVRRHCEALSATSRYFTARGVRPPFALRSTNDERVLQMVAAGLGLTVMPLSYRFPGVARPRLMGFDAARDLGWLFPERTGALKEDPLPLMQRIETRLSARLDINPVPTS